MWKKRREKRRMVSLCWYCLPLSPASSGNNWNGESKGWIESIGASNLSSMNGRLQLDRQGKQTRMGNWEEEGEWKGSLVRRDGREGGILLSSDKTIDCVLPPTGHLFEIRTNGEANCVVHSSTEALLHNWLGYRWLWWGVRGFMDTINGHD